MADDGWIGPHKHIEDALAAIVEDIDWERGQPIYVRRGRKMKKAEMEEWGVEYQWQCDGPSIVVHLPNVASDLSPANGERPVALFDIFYGTRKHNQR
jgi:hypothetical protein